MTTTKPAETKEYLSETVKAWVDSNPKEFMENDKKLYRDIVFDRCEKYLKVQMIISKPCWMLCLSS